MPNTPNQTPTTPKNTNYAKKTPTTPKKHQLCQKNTKYAKKHQICKEKTPNTPKKHQLCKKKTTNTPKKTPTVPKKTPNMQKKTPNMPKNTKYANFHLRCFVANKFLFQIYALCWCIFYRPKMYAGVPKWTNIRYGHAYVSHCVALFTISYSVLLSVFRVLKFAMPMCQSSLCPQLSLS